VSSGAPEIAVGHDRDDLTIALPPHETIEGPVTDGLVRVLAEGKNQPGSFGLIDWRSSAASEGRGMACGWLFLVFDQSMILSAASH
jgi:hypothetical protein